MLYQEIQKKAKSLIPFGNLGNCSKETERSACKGAHKVHNSRDILMV